MKILSLVVTLSCISLVSFLFWNGQKNHCHIPTSSGMWDLEIARTPAEQTRGLMGRTHLCSRCGMLFVFDHEEPQAFWMKDTLIPLDMYFYDKNGNLVDKALNMRPEGETKDPMVYHSKVPSQYVVESPVGSSWNLAILPLNYIKN